MLKYGIISGNLTLSGRSLSPSCMSVNIPDSMLRVKRMRRSSSDIEDNPENKVNKVLFTNLKNSMNISRGYVQSTHKFDRC